MARGRRTAAADPGPSALALAAGRVSRWPSADAWREAGAALDGLLAGPQAGQLLPMLRGTPQLRLLLPELAACDGFDQRSPYHPEGDLYTHIQGVVWRISELGDDPDLRWAALLHDIGKPDAFWLDEGGVGHFYASAEHGTEHHEEVSAQMAGPLLDRFGIGDPRAARIIHLVRHHMFPDFRTVRTARRFLARVGDEHADALLVHRHADWEHEGDPALEVARLAALVERARTEPEPVPAAPLTIGGGVLIAELGMTPGPAVGRLMDALRAEVEGGGLADEPAALIARARRLAAG